jgi:16S rRNA (uracil1498-N3)-methyltransferase
MRTIRIYHPAPLTTGTEIELESQAATHLTRVLRIQSGTELMLFNGDGNEYRAAVTRIHRNHAWACILDAQVIDRESPLNITLCQGISRGERMDYTIQKAVELGVTTIVPVFTERGAVQLKGDRLEKRLKHWQAIVTSACEQCGRNRVPVVKPPTSFDEWITSCDKPLLKLTLDPNATRTLQSLSPEQQDMLLLTGPEGGLSPREIELSRQNGFTGIRLGPRVLRTETAALTALSIIQSLYGDLG